MTTHHPTPGPAGRPPLATAVAVALLMAAVVALLLTAFALPGVESRPRDVPVGAAGPVSTVDQVVAGLAAAQPGALAVTRYADEAALRDAVLEREVYGGFALSPAGVRVLLASGGSPTVATSLDAVGQALGGQTGLPVTTEDLAPLPADDPRGSGLAASALPLTLAGIAPAVVLVRAFPRRRLWRLGTAVAVAVTVGVVMTMLLRSWLGVLPDAGPAVAAALTLGVAASLVVMLGLHAVAGVPGLALGAAVLVLLGNPLSGLATAPEFLGGGWAGLGQALPPGAVGQLLRSTGYFDGAGWERPVLVLCAWLAGGLLLLAAGAVRDRRPATGEVPVAQPVPV